MDAITEDPATAHKNIRVISSVNLLDLLPPPSPRGPSCSRSSVCASHSAINKSICENCQNKGRHSVSPGDVLRHVSKGESVGDELPLPGGQEKKNGFLEMGIEIRLVVEFTSSTGR